MLGNACYFDVNYFVKDVTLFGKVLANTRDSPSYCSDMPETRGFFKLASPNLIYEGALFLQQASALSSEMLIGRTVMIPGLEKDIGSQRAARHTLVKVMLHWKQRLIWIFRHVHVNRKT